jgi:drug/metabolite transporter (DMT)-like permease
VSEAERSPAGPETPMLSPAAGQAADPEVSGPSLQTSSMQARRSRQWGLVFAAAGAILFSGKAIIVKLAFRHGVDAVTLLALRMLVALPLFLLMAAWSARRAPTPLSGSQRWQVLGLGFFGYYLASYLDFAGLAYVTATLERLILYLTPTLVLLVSWGLFGKRPSRLQWIALAVSYLGVGLAFGHDLLAGTEGIALGSALVFASALSYALYLAGSGEVVGRIGSVRLTAYASTVACVLCIGQFLLLRPVSALALPTPVYLLSLANGTLCTVAPVLLLMLGVSRLGSGQAAQIGMLGPVSTIVMSLLILGEPMGPWQVAGTVLVLGGVLLVSRAPAPQALR